MAMTFTLETGLVKRLLHFWLPTYPTPASTYSATDISRWFTATDAGDAECRAIAGPVLESLGPSCMKLPLFHSLETDRKLYSEIAAPFRPVLADKDPHRALALVLLLDQMPRNLFRGEAQTVVYTHYDRIARAVVSHIRELGVDRDSCFLASPVWRLWLYLPLMHSESLDDHKHIGDLLGEMAQRAHETGDDMGAKLVKTSTDVEERHLAPLKKFGRYPWRNQWLGRKNTDSEETWLQEGGEKFGTA